jgi:dihydroorotate dehydrogenase
LRCGPPRALVAPARRPPPPPAVPIVACGGISTPDDVAACLDAGATAVQLYTGLIYGGPGIVGELTGALRERARNPGPGRPSSGVIESPPTEP